MHKTVVGKAVFFAKWMAYGRRIDSLAVCTARIIAFAMG